MRSSGSATERGGVLLLAMLCTAVLLGGLAVAMGRQGESASKDLHRTEQVVRALELAETGIARAELEISSLVDPAGDGVGNMKGGYGGGTYTVTATNVGYDWVIVSTGRTAGGVRRIEQGCRRIPNPWFTNAFFAQTAVSMSGAAKTDAWDSTLGTYASQAINNDAGGVYAQLGGSIGTNAGDISLVTGRIRGDASAGPGYTTTLSGAAVVTGSTAPLASQIDFPSPPPSEFTAAMATNSNGTWTSVGGSVTYTAATKKLAISGGAVVTFPPGNYFFSELSMVGNSTLRVSGPTTIYVTHAFDTSGGSTQNLTGDPANLTIIGHPYSVPGVADVTQTSIRITGGTSCYETIYGPQVALTISGNSPVFGAFMAETVTISGGAYVHYDANLGKSAGTSKLVETYWLERTLPLR